MQQQQTEISNSTQYRYTHHNRIQLLPQYKLLKNQYENFLSDSKIQELKLIYPHAILGRNYQNNVVILDKVGAIKANQIFKVLDEEQFYGYIMQRMLYLAENVLQNKEKVIWIFDLSGKIMQLASKKNYNIVQKIVTNVQKYFPGLLHKLYFINTPMLFDAIWNKISQSIVSYTMKKIAHLTQDLTQLLTDINIQLLPQYLGGKQQDDILTKIDEIKQQRKQNENENKKNKNKSDQQQNNQPQFDFTSLKMALSGLKLGGNGNKSVAQTPLNTEADDVK